MRTVYIDELFLLNLAADYILLYGAAQTSAAHYSRLRLLAGAAFGGLYAVAAYLLPATGSLPAKLVSAAAMLLTAFGYVSRRLFLRRAAALAVYSAIMGGAAYALSLAMGADARGGMIYAPWTLRAAILASAAAVGAISAASRGSSRQRESGSVRIRLTVGGRTAEFSALQDSGNTLRDPLDGSPVLVVEADALAPLFPSETLRLLRSPFPADVMEKLPPEVKWRLLPFVTAAGSRLAPAFRPDSAEADGRKIHILAAVCREPLGAFPALMGEIEGEGREKRANLEKAS